MKKINYIRKDTKVQGGGASYSAVSHDAVISMIRPHMVEEGIVINVVQKDGEFIEKRNMAATPPVKMGLYSGLYSVFFINIDNPSDYLEFVGCAHAAANGDKAPGKAISYVVKTAILKVFSIETGENDESRGELNDTQTGNNSASGEDVAFIKNEMVSMADEKQQLAYAYFFDKLKVTKEAIGAGNISVLQASNIKKMLRQSKT